MQIRSGLLVAVALFIIASPVLADDVATFSSLPEGDELVVMFASHGCFHHESYELTFRRSKEAVVHVVRLPLATLVKVSDELSKVDDQANDGVRVELGDLTLTAAEVEGLDRLLTFYRSRPKASCTTIDDVSISQRRDNKQLAQEKFTDGSCRAGGEGRPTFSALIDRVRKARADDAP